MKARLLESIEIGPEVRHFVFEAVEQTALEYTPGQFVSFSDTIDGKRITRAYSIASAPKDNRFALCLNRVRDGLFSPCLFAMAPGEMVDMAGPLGFFVPRTPFRDALFIATGTGIAPFRGMLEWRPVIDSGKAITLLYGARYEPGLVYRGEFEKLAAENLRFHLLLTITRPEPVWTGRTGRVQEHLDEALAGRTDCDVYLCGLKAMVDDVRAILKARGLDKKQVFFEKYD